LVSITERTTTLKQPDGVIIKIYERELDGKTGALVKEETQFNTWTDVAYTAEGAPATQPLQLTQRTSTKTLNKKTGAMRVSHEASTGYAYDSFTHYLEMVSSHIKTLVKEELTETEMKTIGYKDKGRDLVEVTTTVYTRSAKTKRLTLSSVEHQTVNGPRPGGIGPPETYTVGAPNSGLRPEIYETIVSSAAGPLPGVNADPYAINVTLSNPNLNLDDLKYIANKYRQASGKTKYTLSWSSPLIPEFQPGVVVLFRGLRDAYGVPVSLSPARIYEASVNSSRNSLEGQYRAIFWR
jgi:hypothetical protein